jgi:hypothetical protein
MDKGLEQEVRRRAGERCEYCLYPQAVSALKHVIDHIIARQHGGPTTLDNLALCCGRCNLHKGPNIAGLDPETGQLTRLFNPRSDTWISHFRWAGTLLEGVTPVGRATVAVLAINQLARVRARRALLSIGELPG